MERNFSKSSFRKFGLPLRGCPFSPKFGNSGNWLFRYASCLATDERTTEKKSESQAGIEPTASVTLRNYLFHLVSHNISLDARPHASFSSRDCREKRWQRVWRASSSAECVILLAKICLFFFFFYNIYVWTKTEKSHHQMPIVHFTVVC